MSARLLTLQINGRKRETAAPAGALLLEVLRENLGLTGAKYGCGEGQCGACTVLLDGRPALSCITPAINAVGRSLETIEGLAQGDQLHPVQEAFIACTAMQCGYCTPGMIMAAVGLLRARPEPSDEEIAEAMQDNVCRCGVYARIVQAIHQAAKELAR